MCISRSKGLVNKISINQDIYAAKSIIGDFKSTPIETVEQDKILIQIEWGIISLMGDILNLKGDIVNATIWGEFNDFNENQITIARYIVILFFLIFFYNFNLKYISSKFKIF